MAVRLALQRTARLTQRQWFTSPACTLFASLHHSVDRRSELMIAPTGLPAAAKTFHQRVIPGCNLDWSRRHPSAFQRPNSPSVRLCASQLQCPLKGSLGLSRTQWSSSPSGVVTHAAAGGAGDASISGESFMDRLAKFSTLVTTLFPLWVIGAAFGGYHKPELFNWFQTEQITNGLMFVMLGMGLTLTFKEIGNVFTKQPALLALGMVLQYSVLPAIGYAISRYFGLERGLAIGIALVSCMPGGTASNIVAYIARGDMPLSVMMTSASTLMAVFMTPLLSSILVGQLVNVDPKAMFLSVLQLVLAPVLVGCTINTLAPGFVSRVRPFMPLSATIVVVLIVGSMISCNVEVMSKFGSTVIPAVAILHCSGFFLGYTMSKVMGLSDKVARTNSIEVGMQSSALAAVLAKIHFPGEPMAVAACIMSACTHATVGSLLAGYWNATVKDPDA